MKRPLTFLILLILFFGCPVLTAWSQINLMTGLDNEIYDEFAQDISKITDVKIQRYSSEGSNQNFSDLLSDSIHLAFIQSDVLKFRAKNNKNISEYIQVFLPLYTEEIHLITTKSSNINCLSDINGLTIGVGSKGSGSITTASIIKQQCKLHYKSVQLPFKACLRALNDHKIDAFFYVGAAPSNALRNLPDKQAKNLKLVPVSDKRLKGYYQKCTINRNKYSWLNRNIKTLGVRSLIVINTRNLDQRSGLAADLLYTDLLQNLDRIKSTGSSHPKWQNVDFANRKHSGWPVYKADKKRIRSISYLLGILAAIFTLIQVYFMINKLWSRKQEKIVAESISVSALIISIVINGLFVANNMYIHNYPQMMANLFWISSSIIMLFIGIGYWVYANKHKSFWNLILHALKLEKHEATDLAKSFFKPNGAEKIIEILGQLAMIDNQIDPRERKFIQPFADAWGIKIDWVKIEKNYGSQNGIGFYKIRNSMKEYLQSSPPDNQVSQLNNLLILLVQADNIVTREEELILEELGGMIDQYLGNNDQKPMFNIAVVPQNKQFDDAIKSTIKGLSKSKIAGGFAYLSEPYYSEKYAEIISERFRLLNLFTVVIKPKYISDTKELIRQIDEMVESNREPDKISEIREIFNESFATEFNQNLANFN